jgi:PAS domain S-box-containing protein
MKKNRPLKKSGSLENDRLAHNIINALPVGMHIYRLEKDGRLVFEGANHSADIILGINNSSFIGKTIEEAFPPLASTEVPLRYREAASTGKTWKNEQISYRDNQIAGAYEVHAFRIDENLMAAAFIDISHHKKTEDRIRFQNLLLKVQEETSLDGILVVDQSGMILSFNSRFSSMWKIPPELFTGGRDEPVLNYVLKQVNDAEGFLTKVRHLYANENETSNDEIRLKDGRIFQRYSAPMTGENNINYGRVWYFRDITEDKRNREAMIESEAEFRGLFEATPTGAVMLIDRRFRRVSSRFCRITGYSAEELMGKPTRFVYPDDAMDRHVDSGLYVTMKSEGIGSCEARLRRKDGTEIDVLIFASPLDPSDFSKGIAAILEDLTEKKKSEAERERLRNELMQAQKMESIGRLAGGIAHDFNNLLTAIMGHTELSMRGLPQENELCSHLGTIMQAARSAAELTGQLLAFSRKQIIDPRIVDLNQIIGHMHKILVRLIGENIDLRLNTQSHVHAVRVDVAQIQQIIINLAVNARDAMPEGGLLTLETANVIIDEAFCRQHNYPTPGNHVMLSVSDTGTGMSDEVKAHLFEPFFTTKETGKGTGLGLATVYGAVQQNHGAIHIYSEEGHGTVFRIYFPSVAEAAMDFSTINASKEMPTGCETVLLVEDNPMVLDFSRSVLEMLGYHVIAARSGEEASRTFNEMRGGIDLLMTDVILPGMNGQALAEGLLQSRPDLKILFNSGYTENAIVSHGVLNRGLNFIGKPFSAFELSRKIRQVLDGQ